MGLLATASKLFTGPDHAANVDLLELSRVKYDGPIDYDAFRRNASYLHICASDIDAVIHLHALRQDRTSYSHKEAKKGETYIIINPIGIEPVAYSKYCKDRFIEGPNSARRFAINKELAEDFPWVYGFFGAYAQASDAGHYIDKPLSAREYHREFSPIVKSLLLLNFSTDSSDQLREKLRHGLRCV